jgi:hypothetical protein
MTIEQGKSKLIISKSVLMSNGYKEPPHYICMLNYMFLYCLAHDGYSNHELLAKNFNEWRYVCMTCKNAVEFVG